MKILLNGYLSEDITKVKDGYLICKDAIMLKLTNSFVNSNEISFTSDFTDYDKTLIKQQIFSEATIKSFENKPVTLEHPEDYVNVYNYNIYSVGFVRDVYIKQDDNEKVIIGTLIITDKRVVDLILSKKPLEISCGFEYTRKYHENDNHNYINVNYIALCKKEKDAHITISDFAYSRQKSIDVCWTLGIQFIKHFDKIYHNSTSQNVNHWISEMDAWYKKVKSIKLKSNNKELLMGDLRDHFFTACALPEDYMTNPDYKEEKAYDTFVENLIRNNDIRLSLIISKVIKPNV